MIVLIMYGTFEPSAQHLDRLSRLGPNVRAIPATSEDVALTAIPEAEVVLGHRYLCQVLPHARHLRWVQSTAAGVDRIVFPDLIRLRPLLTRCPIFADVAAWHAFTLCLAVLRRIPEAVRSQAEGRWNRSLASLPFPQRALVLGLGEIGARLATLLRATGIHVIGAARRDTPERRRLCDEICTGNGWRRHLSDVDACFLCLPLDRTTRGLFDASAIRSLSDRAVLINIGRSGVLDMAALQQRLRDGGLGGAGIDVLTPVPAPDDAIWRTPRLLVTPKVSTEVPDRRRRVEAFMEEQVERYVAGGRPRYAVDYGSMVPSDLVPAWGG